MFLNLTPFTCGETQPQENLRHFVCVCIMSSTCFQNHPTPTAVLVYPINIRGTLGTILEVRYRICSVHGRVYKIRSLHHVLTCTTVFQLELSFVAAQHTSQALLRLHGFSGRVDEETITIMRCVHDIIQPVPLHEALERILTVAARASLLRREVCDPGVAEVR